MELPNHQEMEIPTPLNTSYSSIYNPTPQNHIIHIPTPANGQNLTITPSITANMTDNTLIVPYNNKINMVRYRECLKNHAASIGGAATDGCGEFMPSGEEGTIEALTCSACNCHRNFHKKEIEGDPSSFDYFHHGPHFGRIDRKVLLGRMLACNVRAESDEERGVPHHQGEKKRFRTRFSQEQKEKMLGFAERVGWKIQKQEESVVRQFCEEIGVKRRVLKVWMHNNKHSLAKKISTSVTLAQNPI